VTPGSTAPRLTLPRSLQPVEARMRSAVELDQARIRQLTQYPLGGPVADVELLLDLPARQRAVLHQTGHGPALLVVERQLRLTTGGL